MGGLGDGGKSGVLSERVTNERTTGLDEAFRAQVITRNLFGDDESDLRERSGKKETGRMAECVLWSAIIDVDEQR
jgi:hypothetical protein